MNYQIEMLTNELFKLLSIIEKHADDIKLTCDEACDLKESLITLRSWITQDITK